MDKWFVLSIHIDKTETAMEKNEIVLFEYENNRIKLPVKLQGDIVWLTRNQMVKLFDRDVKTIDKHINNALKEEADMPIVANLRQFSWKLIDDYTPVALTNLIEQKSCASDGMAFFI